MDRRALIGGAVAAAASLAARPGPAARRPERGRVRRQLLAGPRADFPNWVTQLQDAGDVGPLRNFAKSGATAATIGTNHFARQLRLWREAGRPVGDRVIVFLGINDILKTDTFDASNAGSRRGSPS